ncbi:MAG: hypothetical protein ACP5PO_00075 [Desulfurella sp.]|uniref:hypothetical protein n=1 Tax=Desulfurella sp. TaxID=1962857 RepID=UPI003D0AA0E5
MINFSNLDPILHYKLDPGEWGSSAPSSAAFSIGRVSTHEADNISRFKKQAIQKGCYVVSSSVSLNISKQGEYLAATSGKSQVIIYCPKKDENKYYKQLVPNINNQINQLKEQEKYTNNSVQKDEILKKIENLKFQKQAFKAIEQYSKDTINISLIDFSV